MRRPFVAAALLLALPAHTATIMINNGLAPPNPKNVIDYFVDDSDAVYIRNSQCPPGWPTASPSEPCPYPGDPTDVALVEGGETEYIYIYDYSTLAMSGGSVSNRVQALNSSTFIMSGVGSFVHTLHAYDSSRAILGGGGSLFVVRAQGSSAITIDGTAMRALTAYDSSAVTVTSGNVEGIAFGDLTTAAISGGVFYSMCVGGSATVVMSGGSAAYLQVGGTLTMSGGSAYRIWSTGSGKITMSGGTLIGGDPSHVSFRAEDASLIETVGGGFEVDGIPAPYGVLTARSGRLTGTLASGDSLNALFCHAGCVHSSGF